MPEIVTKYPSVLIQELKDAGAKCGLGVSQQILVKCPKEKFCRLPTGEICVYGLEDIHSMTQISPGNFAEVLTGVPPMYSISNLILIIFIFGLGVAVGIWVNGRHSNPKSG